jgi:cellulose synthase/poly-beta-1,6-N-acetylglucosamine synthase-like glycosyltransferase
MIILLELAISFFAVVSLIYVVYFVFVLRTKRKEEYVEELSAIVGSIISRDELPKVTVLIPAYNEEETMYAKIKNISEFDYPHDKIEVFVLDDSSTDKTREIVESAFKEFNVTGRILRNETRRGVNYSYNQAVAQVGSECILTTDADAIIPQDSMLSLVKILTNLTDVGAVAAKMVPIHNKTTVATRTADAYADSYNSMLLAESAIFSTFPGSTSCMLMRKSAFSAISTSYGSSDGNISLSIIRKGFKFILAPSIVYYEPVSQRILEQRRQKIRRATRLIQSTLLNSRAMLFSGRYKQFGRRIFPLRFIMMTLCPVLIISSIFLFLIFAYFFSSLLFVAFAASIALVLILGIKTDIRALNLVASFLIHQAYLFTGFLLLYRRMSVWKRIERESEQSQ